MNNPYASPRALDPTTALSAEAAGGEQVYGWVMVPLAAVGMVATLPGRTHGLGMITERLLADGRLGIAVPMDPLQLKHRAG